MNSDVLFGQAKADEQVLTFDILDEVLERAATAEPPSLWHFALAIGTAAACPQ
jgi:hypothetical protein